MEQETALTVDEIKKNIQDVQEKIAAAANKVGRSFSDVQLVVVTKTHSVDVVKKAVEAGARLLGENYAEEGIEKKSSFSGQSGLQWHMIGHIQSRKARQVVEHYDFIHSLDSLKLAHRLNSFSLETQRILPVLLECNVSGEETKFGFMVWDEHRWDGVLNEIEQIVELPHIKISGLMTMAPYYDNPEHARPVFRKLMRFCEYLGKKFPKNSWQELSMGMSADYEVAVQEGATMVRVGQAILGSRYYC